MVFNIITVCLNIIQFLTMSSFLYPLFCHSEASKENNTVTTNAKVLQKCL